MFLSPRTPETKNLQKERSEENVQKVVEGDPTTRDKTMTAQHTSIITHELSRDQHTELYVLEGTKEKKDT